MAEFKPYFDVQISEKYSEEERRAIASEIIDRVISRSEDGIGANGRSFVKYSNSYAEEKGQTNVDLTFSGEMLSDMELVKNSRGLIRIGYSEDYEGIGKVEGNVLGTYGNSRPVTKGRNFLGITQKELNEILSNYPLRDEESRKERIAQLKEANIISDKILKNTGFEIDEDDE